MLIVSANNNYTMMNKPNQKLELSRTVEAFAGALNAADATSLQSFFTGDGKFMPEGKETIETKQLETSGVNYLNTNSFQIEYEVLDISIDDNFASVMAIGKTSEKRQGEDVKTTKTSRDFFVFKKVDEAWKIHRYIFNNVSLA